MESGILCHPNFTFFRESYFFPLFGLYLNYGGVKADQKRCLSTGPIQLHSSSDDLFANRQYKTSLFAIFIRPDVGGFSQLQQKKFEENT